MDEILPGVYPQEQADAYNEGVRDTEARILGVAERLKEYKNVRDRGFIGSGSSRKPMTGVHREERKSKWNAALQALSDEVGKFTSSQTEPRSGDQV